MNIKIKLRSGKTLVLTMIDEVVKFIIDAKKAYYEAEPIVDDDVFDYVQEELRKIDPTNEVLTMVGYTPTLFRAKVKHTIPMRSMQKGHTIDEIKTWAKNTFGKFPDLIIEPKLDGSSLKIIYENGRMQQAVTRGSDQIGEDRTDRVRLIPSAPISIKTKERIEVCGEVYLPKNNKLSKPDEALRNIAAGLLNRGTGGEDCKHLAFVAYEVSGKNFKTVEEKLKFLKQVGFETIEPLFAADAESLEQTYDDYIQTLRDMWQYESDGLILQPNDTSISDQAEDNNAHHPRWAIAWKPPAEERETVLTGIDWRVTRFGTLTPTALMKPVTIMGVTIQRATLHNMRAVIGLHLNRNDKILIKRSGDVIPQVIENISFKKVADKLIVKLTKENSGKPLEELHELIADELKKTLPTLLVPDTCPSCGHNLVQEEVQLQCPNTKCPDRQLDKITYWVEKCEMKAVADSTITLLFNEGLVKSIADLYSLKAKQLVGIKGMGEKKITNLLLEIDKTRTMNAVEFLSRLGIPMIGSSGKALKKLGIKTLDDFRKFPGDDSAIGRSVIAWKRELVNIQLVDELSTCIDVKAHVPKVGKKICFTGSGPLKRNELIALAEKIGYIFEDGVSKELDLLVCDDVEGTSSKLQKARKLGVGLMDYTEFLKKVSE